MARKHSPGPRLLDTSAVVYQLHGHTYQQAAVREAISGSKVLVPVFVRMEYLRSVILNLIEMWCLICESVTVQRKCSRRGSNPRHSFLEKPVLPLNYGSTSLQRLSASALIGRPAVQATLGLARKGHR